jgi:ubiquinone/menaquinone biosynthesis C-methylase UbiE
MLENVEQNLVKWDQNHPWSKDGDEWSGQAKQCGVPYERWKASLIANMIAPFINPKAQVLEIAPGHGRWTEHLLAGSGHVTVVDISPTCLSYCRTRFQQAANIDYFLTTGHQLPRYIDDKIDFVWSYDSFVHMDRSVIAGYLGEIKRVLKIGGTSVLHHAGIENLDAHVQSEHPGWRSQMNADVMRQLAEEAGLEVISQFVYWDEEAKIGVPRFGDQITWLGRKV